MCEGCAVLVNDKECIICDGSSHSAKGKNKDDYLALNVIYDSSKKNGYRIELDCHDIETERYYMEKMFLIGGKPNHELLKKARNEIKRNEARVFKILCTNMQKATIKGDQDNGSATIKGDQDNGSATIKGDQDNGSATIKGDQDNGSATIKGDQYNSSATIGEIIIYNMRITSSKETTRLIREFSESCSSWGDATLTNFIKWLRKTDIPEARR